MTGNIRISAVLIKISNLGAVFARFCEFLAQCFFKDLNALFLLEGGKIRHLAVACSCLFVCNDLITLSLNILLRSGSGMRKLPGLLFPLQDRRSDYP